MKEFYQMKRSDQVKYLEDLLRVSVFEKEVLELDIEQLKKLICHYSKVKSDIQELVTAQGQPGTWDSDHYMRGLYNGLELALSQIESRAPIFKEAIWTK